MLHDRREWNLPHRAPRATRRPTDHARDEPPAAAGASARGPSGYDAVDPEFQEELLVVLHGIGAVMFLTTNRVIVARDGIERRPRTGIQTFRLDEIRHLRLELGSAPSGRIAIWTAARQEAVSMFFEARSLDRAHSFIDTARPLIARQRRGGPGDRPVRPPSGPANSGSDPS